jgi:hypothetical protein
MKYFTYTLLLVQILVIAPAAASEPAIAAFQKLNQARWQVALEDSCTQDWKRNWTLDGKKATIIHSDNGMDFRAGPTWKDDASHAVLWTKKNFQGDIKIEYEYTRTDDADSAVTILYVQATGSGRPPYARDISEWADLREIPSMSMYWRNMHTYHISYAAFGASKDDPQADYIRARRYMPGRNANLRGTELQPDYFEAGLFDTNVPHRITVIKVGDELFMRIRNRDRTVYCRWTNNSRPILEGRIGLRHMFTRGARYKDFRVYTLESRTETSE